MLDHLVGSLTPFLIHRLHSNVSAPARVGVEGRAGRGPVRTGAGMLTLECMRRIAKCLTGTRGGPTDFCPASGCSVEGHQQAVIRLSRQWHFVIATLPQLPQLLMESVHRQQIRCLRQSEKMTPQTAPFPAHPSPIVAEFCCTVPPAMSTFPTVNHRTSASLSWPARRSKTSAGPGAWQRAGEAILALQRQASAASE